MRHTTREIIFALAKRIRENCDLKRPIRNLEDAMDIIMEHLPDAIDSSDELAEN